ncbi:hypothetical protein GCM10020229_04430 [Kitasatospora albolonga]
MHDHHTNRTRCAPVRAEALRAPAARAPQPQASPSAHPSRPALPRPGIQQSHGKKR